MDLSRSRRIATIALAAVVLAIDVWEVRTMRGASYHRRAVLALVGVLVMWLASRRHRGSVGLTLRTEQGAAWWWKVTAIMAGVAGIVVLAATGVLIKMGYLEPVRLAPRRAVDAIVHACIWAPLVEEALYRLVLVVPLAATLRTGWAILISGLLFAALHVLYGNPAPANAVGGFFLTWAYLKSGSLLVPIILHAAGNLFVIGTQIAAYHVL